MKFTDKEILYLDNHLIAVHKDVGLCTLPIEGEQDSVLERAKNTLKKMFDKPGNVFVHPVHRLDGVTSGIVLCARTSKALSRLNKTIREGHWKKKYIARIEGSLPNDQGELVHFLKKGDRKVFISHETDKNAKKAILRYQKIQEDVVLVDLITGRTHQIRAQFSAIGCPIRGDKKYGSKKPGLREKGIDLHHQELSFEHPTKKEIITIQDLLFSFTE